jgi:hypothetical protein
MIMTYRLPAAATHTGHGAAIAPIFTGLSPRVAVPSTNPAYSLDITNAAPGRYAPK